jgi:hypothetical protein
MGIRSWLDGMFRMPEEQAQGQVRGLLSGVANSVVDTVKTPGNLMKPNPYPAGSEEESWYNDQRSKAETQWAPEMGLNLMGTGGIVGVPVKGAEQALGSGILRKKPVIGGYHGTVAPEQFSNFKPSEVDMGTHFTTNPNVSAQYSLRSHSEPFVKLTEGARTVPVVGDVKNPLKYPMDPINWKDSEGIIEGLKDSIKFQGFKAPKGILEDFSKAESSAGGWEKNFIPMLKDRKYDSVVYPHTVGPYGGSTLNSYMALDPGQVKMRFSPEGQELIKERGVIEPGKKLHGIMGDVKDWNSRPETNRWQPPPDAPKPSSYQQTTVNKKPYDLAVLDELLRDQKRGLMSGEEFWTKYRQLTSTE